MKPNPTHIPAAAPRAPGRPRVLTDARSLSVNLTASLYLELERRAADAGISKSQMTRALLVKALGG